MRFHESLSYLNNNNNNNIGNFNGNGNGNGNGGGSNSNYQHHGSQNIDRTGNCNAVQTVKTFTSNGNHQSNINDSDTILDSIKTDNTQNSYFEINESINVDGGALNSHQNWPLERDLGKSLAAAFNETYSFYGTHRTLKTRENDVNEDDDNANGNISNFNVFKKSGSIDLIDDSSSSDIEAELNDLINRSNLCRQNFEYESNKGLTSITSHSDDQFMDEEGTLNFSLITDEYKYLLKLKSFSPSFLLQKNFHRYRFQHH